LQTKIAKFTPCPAYFKCKPNSINKLDNVYVIHAIVSAPCQRVKAARRRKRPPEAARITLGRIVESKQRAADSQAERRSARGQARQSAEGIGGVRQSKGNGVVMNSGGRTVMSRTLKRNITSLVALLRLSKTQHVTDTISGITQLFFHFDALSAGHKNNNYCLFRFGH
jgi:hypothetical protein